MPIFRIFIALTGLAVGGTALADTDCSDPPAAWKPREELRRQVELGGWTVQRIKVDDGCYEVRGNDRLGNKVKAKYSPATLRIRSLEVEFGPNSDASDYLLSARPNAEREGRGHARRGNNQ